MSEGQLSEEELHLLDIIANLEPLLQYQISGFWLTKDRPIRTEQLNEMLNKLCRLRIILIQKGEYQITVSLNPDMKEKAIAILSDLWKYKKVQKETLLAEAEKNHTGVLKFLELKSTQDNKPQIGFSDYYWDALSHNFCQRMMEISMVFKHTWSSRKHSYETYYLRKILVDVEKTLQDFVLNKVNPEGLELETDWRVLAILMFSETAPKVQDIKLNFPNLTSDEVDEILFRLESRGILSREREELRLPKATKDIIKSFFILNRYQDFKSLVTQQLRERVSERISNLFLLGLLKRVLISSQVQRLTEPFCAIKKTLVNVDETDLKEAVKLGIVFLTENEVIIAHEALRELETLFRSAISEKSLIRIPANDIYTAIITWRKIFGECKEYIKIQDEYVNEETLQIIQSYSPSQVNITVLSSIEGARDADIEEMKQRVDAIRNSGRKINLFFVGDKEGKAPFHFRYIISRNLCYSVTTSIKQVGKSKDADLIPISNEEKDGLVEPAFNYWIGVPKERLKEMGINRMNFDEWLKQRLADKPI
jgi:hypothetical protein